MNKIGILATYLTQEHRDKIQAAADLAGREVHYFKDAADCEANLGDCEILYGYIPAGFIKKAASLKWLATAAAGVDALLKDEIYPHEGIILTNSSGSYGVTISEHMIMTTLMLMRRMPAYQEEMRRQEWGSLGNIRSIYGSTIVVVGTGDIGTNFACRAKAMGAARVIGVRRTLKEADPAFDEVYTTDRLKEAVVGADVVALALPATASTIGVFSKEIIDSLPSRALVLNVGRGNAVDQDALIDALNEERIAGAALDVMVPEPLPKGHPLFSAKNCILTPHCSGTMTLQHTNDANVDTFCRNLVRYARGEEMENVIDRGIGY
ncbi:MAG: D-2-hydroxyacid dehydrogenase [Lachnospiraceae bacterium]|nr:D-2-hydroxyacid dehydrogenase [Lachnospiraceae bacterium]